MPGQAAAKHYPGGQSKVKIRRVMTATREGELDVAGPPAHAPGHIPVVFDHEDVAGLNLPVAAHATISVYTGKVHAPSILRKLVLRIRSW